MFTEIPTIPELQADLQNKCNELNSNLTELTKTVVDYSLMISVSIAVTAGTWSHYTIPSANVPSRTGYALVGMILSSQNAQGIAPSYQSNSKDIWVYGRTTGTASVIAIPVFAKITS